MHKRTLDQAEHEIQTQLRDKILQKAVKQQYATIDQVKAFNAKLMLSDVLHERDLQLELRQKKQEQEKQIEKQWEDLEAAKIETFDEKMKEKARRQVERTLQQRKSLKDQMHNVKMKVIKEYQDSEKEGELLKRQANEELESKIQKDLQKRRQELENA